MKPAISGHVFFLSKYFSIYSPEIPKHKGAKRLCSTHAGAHTRIYALCLFFLFIKGKLHGAARPPKSLSTQKAGLSSFQPEELLVITSKYSRRKFHFSPLFSLILLHNFLYTTDLIYVGALFLPHAILPLHRCKDWSGWRN